MQPNATEFQWTGKKVRAIELVAQDDLSDSEIAKDLGINKATLERWKRNPEFTEKVNEAKSARAAALRAEGIAIKQNRIDAAVARWNDLETLRAERAADDHIASFPGGKTGFVAVDLKLVKTIIETTANDPEGPMTSTREYWVHSFDNTLWTAYLNIEKQIAQETGQWEEKSTINGEVLVRRYVGVDPDDV